MQQFKYPGAISPESDHGLPCRMIGGGVLITGPVAVPELAQVLGYSKQAVYDCSHRDTPLPCGTYVETYRGETSLVAWAATLPYAGSLVAWILTTGKVEVSEALGLPLSAIDAAITLGRTDPMHRAARLLIHSERDK